MTEKKINTKAAAATIGIHILLLLLFLVIGYTMPAAIANTDEMGMEVNLGNSDDGSGDDQPMSVDMPGAQRQEAIESNKDAEEADTREILKSDNDDGEAIKTNAAKNQHTATKSQITTRDQPKPKLLYPGSTATGGNNAGIDKAGKGEGNGQGPGDKGVPGGTPGSPNYSGSPGNGTGGISHSLSNRNIIAYPEKEASFKENGKVTVRVTVNRQGEIVAKNIVSGTNAELKRIALQKVEKIKFNKSTEAPQEQFGNITFVFKTRSQKQ